MEIGNDILQHIRAEMLMIIPVLIVIGKILKESAFLKNKYIPLVLAVISIILSVGWIFAYTTENTVQAIIDGFIQGILLAGAAVCSHQIFKQYKKDE